MVNILKYRRYVMLISQLVGAKKCVYFILHVQYYKISLPWLNYFLPEFTLKINKFINSKGTFILVVPLTIIILSLLNPENSKLKICSSFFGIASTLITLFNCWWHDTLGGIIILKYYW